MTAKLLLATSLSLVLSVPAARACGGFFCTTFPMNQVAENILFVQGEGTVTTHVQLLYSGTASDFAWILPLPSVPDLAVSHNQIFTRLQFATRPGFYLNFEDEDEAYCGFPELATVDIGSGGPPDVEVVAREQIGPYDTAVITSEDPQAIVDWLVENGYQLGELGVPLLTPYVEGDFFFLALKLAADREVGDLQPIAMTYAAETPGIPIRLTAVATVPDLGVIAWILGEHRAIPQNYLHVQINEALIDWFKRRLQLPRSRHPGCQRGRRPGVCHRLRRSQQYRQQLFLGKLRSGAIAPAGAPRRFSRRGPWRRVFRVTLRCRP